LSYIEPTAETIAITNQSNTNMAGLLGGGNNNANNGGGGLVGGYFHPIIPYLLPQHCY